MYKFFLAPNIDNIYKIPYLYTVQNIHQEVLKTFKITKFNEKFTDLKKIYTTLSHLKKPIVINLIVKYGYADAYISLIESGDITWEGCISDYYTFDYNIDNINDMIGTKFSYNNSKSLLSQAVLYLSINTNKENDIEAEINNIRREINIIRKEMNLKLTKL